MGDYEDPGLFYWHRNSVGAQAEVDYLCEANGNAVPVEIKSSAAGHLRSMHQYLNSFPTIPGGIKCSTGSFGKTGKIFSVPLYAAYRIAEIAGTLQ
jgi:hypothetical protein